MAVITIDDLTGWAEETKLPISDVENTLEDAMRAEVFARVQTTYDVTGWISPSTTPSLIRKVIGAKVVAATYRKSYSEIAVEQELSYAVWLERWADNIINGIVDGSVDLIDATSAIAGSNEPSFWPTDQTGATDQYDALGNTVSYAGDEDIKFRMGTMF